MNVVEISLDRLGTRKDARPVNEQAVKGLIESIREVGILNPIRVRPKRLYVNGVEDDGYEIIAGAHRMRAALKLCLETVPCVISDDNDIDAEISMIDENLCRAELSPADRAAQTARRKALYLKKHPETAHGAAGAAGRWDEDAKLAPAFHAETAAATGKSARAVQRDAERGERVCDEALQLVRGTDLDKGTYLDKLKKIDAPEEQVATVNRALSGLARAAERERQDVAARKEAKQNEAGARRDAARALAEVLIHVAEEEWATVTEYLRTATSKDILVEFSKLVASRVAVREAA